MSSTVREYTVLMTRAIAWLEFATAPVIGLLVGLIPGLSISPVTSTVLGTLSAGLLILPGLKEPKQGVQLESHAFRI